MSDDDALRAAAELLDDLGDAYNDLTVEDGDERDLVAAHLRAYAEAEIVRRLPPPCHPAGPKMLAAIERWERMTKLEDAARAVVDDYEKQVAICDTGAMVWVKRRLLDALAAALGKEAEDGE